MVTPRNGPSPLAANLAPRTACIAVNSAAKTSSIENRVPLIHVTNRHSFCSDITRLVCRITRDADTSNQHTPVSLWSGTIETGFPSPENGAIIADGMDPFSRRTSCATDPQREMNPMLYIFVAKASVICSTIMVQDNTPLVRMDTGGLHSRHPASYGFAASPRYSSRS